MDAFNGGQRPGVQRRGACVVTRAGKATEGGGKGESRLSTGHRLQETRGPPSDAAGRSANIAGGRHI